MQLKSLTPKQILIKPQPAKLIKVKAGQDWSVLTDKIRKGKPLTTKKYELRYIIRTIKRL